MTLATLDDYANLTGTVVAEADEDRIEALLAMASDAVRLEAQQTIEEATYEDVVLFPWEGIAYFPERPVTAVGSVTVNLGLTDEKVLTEADYRWTPGGKGRPAMLIKQFAERDDYWRVGDRLTVTYDAGWETVPAPLIAAVVAMTKSIVDRQGGQAVVSTTTGPFSVTYDTMDRQSSTLALSPAALAVVRRLCHVPRFASVPVQPS